MAKKTAKKIEVKKPEPEEVKKEIKTAPKPKKTLGNVIGQI